jgi:hypothetical protein
MRFLVPSLLVVGVVTAVPNLVERAPGIAPLKRQPLTWTSLLCCHKCRFSVLSHLSANTGATFCDQLLDTSLPTETLTVTSTSTDTSFPVTTTTDTTYPSIHIHLLIVVTRCPVSSPY